MRDIASAILLAAIVFAGCSKAPPAATVVAGTNITITGTVVERLDGPPYSYVRLKTDNGEKVWVAVPIATVENGGKVTVKHGAALKNFQAPRLGRKFDVVVFGTMERD